MQRIKNVEAASLSSYIYEQFNETAAWIWTCGEKAEKLDQCPIGTPVFSISHVNAHPTYIIGCSISPLTFTWCKKMLLNYCKNMSTKFPAGKSSILYKWLHHDQNMVITEKNQYQSGWQCVSILDGHLIVTTVACRISGWVWGKIIGLQGHHRHHCPWHVDDQTWLCLLLVQHSSWGKWRIGSSINVCSLALTFPGDF